MTKQKTSVLGSVVGIFVGIIIVITISFYTKPNSGELHHYLTYAIVGCFLLGGILGSYLGSDTKKG